MQATPVKYLSKTEYISYIIVILLENISLEIVKLSPFVSII